MTIHHSMPMENYHACPAIGSSRAKLVLDSLQLFKDDVDGLVEHKKTAAMHFGTVVHLAVLEPDVFRKTTSSTGPINQKTNKPYGADTKAFTEWQEANPSVTMVDPALYTMIERMPVEIKDIVSGKGYSESSVFTSENGVSIKCRPDKLIGTDIFDLKTINDIDAIDHHIKSYRYYFSASWYRHCMKLETGKPHTFTLIFAESAPPYRWRIVDLSPEYIEEGDYYVGDVLRKLSRAYELNNWRENGTLRVVAAKPPSLGSFDHGDEQ